MLVAPGALDFGTGGFVERARVAHAGDVVDAGEAALPGCRSAQDLAWTFVFEGVAGAQAVQGEMKFPPPNMPPMPANWQGMVGEVEKALKGFGDKVRKVDENQLNTTVKFMTGPKQQGDLRRLDVLWFLLNDQIHHRGQFSVYLRMAGGKVPSIYGPSSDEKWN